MKKCRFRPLLEVLEDRFLPTASTWTYAGPSAGMWSDANNWSAGVPGTGTVTEADFTSATGDCWVAGSVSGIDLKITVNVNLVLQSFLGTSPVTLGINNLTMSSGDISPGDDLGDNVTLTGTNSTWTGGNINSTAHTNNLNVQGAGAKLTISNTAGVTLGSELDVGNGATVFVRDQKAQVTVTNDVPIVVENGGHLYCYNPVSGFTGGFDQPGGNTSYVRVAGLMDRNTADGSQTTDEVFQTNLPISISSTGKVVVENKTTLSVGAGNTSTNDWSIYNNGGTLELVECKYTDVSRIRQGGVQFTSSANSNGYYQTGTGSKLDVSFDINNITGQDGLNMKGANVKIDGGKFTFDAATAQNFLTLNMDKNLNITGNAEVDMNSNAGDTFNNDLITANTITLGAGGSLPKFVLNKEGTAGTGGTARVFLGTVNGITGNWSTLSNFGGWTPAFVNNCKQWQLTN